MTPVMGLDTDSKKIAYVATFSVTGLSLLKDAFGYASSNGDVDQRRAALYYSAKALFGELPEGTHVFCEEPLALKNGKTTRLLGLVAGAVWTAFQEVNPDAFWHWVDVSSWKKNVIGKGNASKEEIAAFISQSPDFKQLWKEYHASGRGSFLVDCFTAVPDLYDAWALKTYGVRIVPTLEVA